MSTTDTSGADTSGAASDQTPATFTLGQVVRHTWEDDYHTEPQTRFGLVVELPTEGDASVPEDEQVKTYGIAWLAAGTAALEPDALEAI